MNDAIDMTRRHGAARAALRTTRERLAYRRLGAWLATILLLVQLCWQQQALAQLPPPGTASQFDIVGFLQEATLNGPNPTAVTGGKLKVNGHVVVVPDHTIVMLPANALTWKELFDQAPAPYTGVSSGMALADSPQPLTTYEVHVIGNRVGDTYIAGLIFLSQQDLNAGAGYINYIDYAAGEMYVGGKLTLDLATGVPQNVLSAGNPGTRVRINDPDGKYGRAGSPDKRFTLDPDNPTIRSATGFPMCLPRTNPNDPQAIPDALCPQGNRPKDVAGNFVPAFTMPAPAALAPGQLPDPRIMAPFQVGDYVNFAGTLVTDSGTSGAYPGGSAGTYVSAHTVTNNVAIYTAPGTNPAYVAVEVTIIGTGGLTVIGAGEAAIRTRFEGMTTDPSRNIHLYGIDVNTDGSTTDRDWGTIAVDPGPPNGAVQGRWRFRPPCTAVTATVKACTPPAGGNFIPPTREVRAVIEGAWTPATRQADTGGANGLMAGQYRAPILEYIFPENVPGTPPPPNNFETIPFLAQGGYTSSAGTIVGQLNPWPGAQAPGTCTAPAANAGTDFSVASGARAVPLTGSATGTGPFTYAWQAVSPPGTVITNPTSPNPTFDAPVIAAGGAAQTMTFRLTVTGCKNQTATSTVTVTVLPPSHPVPVINPIAPVTVNSGVPVTLTASSSGAAGTTYTWTQTGGPAQAFSQQPAGSASIRFTRAIPLGQITRDVLTFTVTANDGGQVSQPVSVTVTVVPVPDVVTVTTAEYRTSKQRLDLTVTSSIVNPNLVLTLQPYRTTTGALFDPGTLGATLANTGGGTYTLVLVGAPQPAAPPATPLTVKSSIGGTSPQTALTRIRN
ncbi:hypothetical protein AB4Z48_23405 [Cupriavidus sp. 2TAF22]|uniref:PKD domain-containing protein n=1 Tax=unclassified Cupriavidus TaxID=2640874 RepID=UPI003F8EEE97